jgi:hypothetical protein
MQKSAPTAAAIQLHIYLTEGKTQEEGILTKKDGGLLGWLFN